MVAVYSFFVVFIRIKMDSFLVRRGYFFRVSSIVCFFAILVVVWIFFEFLFLLGFLRLFLGKGFGVLFREVFWGLGGEGIYE